MNKHDLTIISSTLAISVALIGTMTHQVKAATNETPVSGVVQVQQVENHPNWKINLLDSEGKYQNQYLSPNTNWKAFAKANINGQDMYRLGSDKQWIPSKYSKFTENEKSAVKPNVVNKPNVVHAPTINNNPNWKIALVDQNGKYTGKYISTNTNWKVLEVKQINQSKHYRLGTQEQWAPSKFFTGSVTLPVTQPKSEIKAPVENNTKSDNVITPATPVANSVPDTNDNVDTNNSQDSKPTTPVKVGHMPTDKDKSTFDYNLSLNSGKQDSIIFKNSSPKYQKYYLDALKRAKEVRANPNSTIEDYDRVMGRGGMTYIDYDVNTLIGAINMFDGVAPARGNGDSAKMVTRYLDEPVYVDSYNPIIMSDAQKQAVIDGFKKANPFLKDVKLYISPIEHNYNSLTVTLVYPDGSTNDNLLQSRVIREKPNKQIKWIEKNLAQYPEKPLKVGNPLELTPEEEKQVIQEVLKANKENLDPDDKISIYKQIFSIKSKKEKFRGATINFDDGSKLILNRRNLLVTGKVPMNTLYHADYDSHITYKMGSRYDWELDSPSTFIKNYSNLEVNCFWIDKPDFTKPGKTKGEFLVSFSPDNSTQTGEIEFNVVK